MTKHELGELTVAQVARICHEANRAYCQTLGDTSQLPWEETPAEIQASYINGVGFRLDNPYAPASASHRNWLEEKRRAGWVYGPVKDLKAKTHPCIMPFNQLPREQQAKDWLFTNVVKAFTAVDMLIG